MEPIKLNYLDHVAIRAEDIQASAKWYETVLGLKKYEPAAWNGVPIFMLSGKSGVAIFPKAEEKDDQRQHLPAIRIDHFAFNVDKENFELAQLHFDQLGIYFEFQDHKYFHSIYMQDPDGHKVELTMMVVNEADFYKL